MRIRAEGIGKMYGESQVLSDVSFALKEGTCLCVLGPSGAGKTTLLRILNLLERSDSGRLLFDEIDPYESGALKEVRRRMVMIMQKPIVFRRTVWENVAYGLKLRKLDGDAVEEKTLKALRMVGLEGLRDRMATTLSGGEAQRVAFARAIVLDPELLLLDEFTANLDPQNVMALERMTRRFRAVARATVIISTHDLFQAKRFDYPISLLVRGRIVETNECEAFFTSPKTPEGRAFVEGGIVY